MMLYRWFNQSLSPCLTCLGNRCFSTPRSITLAQVAPRLLVAVGNVANRLGLRGRNGLASRVSDVDWWGREGVG